MLRKGRQLVTASAVLLVVAGCTSDDSPTSAPSTAGSTAGSTAASPSSAPRPSQPPTAPPTGAAPTTALNPVSLPALAARTYDGRALRLRRVLDRTDAYLRYFATYRSGDLRISAVVNVPRGRGPFPVVVLNHGYIDPAVYVNGQGLRREQDALVRAGYVVLHTDYRGHAQSDDDPRTEKRLRLGYTEDVINAIMAVKRSTFPAFDRERIGLLGRSMGGGVTYNVLVTKPGLVDAAVVYAPVSSNTADNFDRWIRDDPGRDGLSKAIIDAYGSPERNPAFWRGVSPRTYFDAITEPVLIHHGTADETCPIRWSRQSYSALRAAGKDARLLVYDGEGHAFGPQWALSMRRTVAFFDRELR